MYKHIIGAVVFVMLMCVIVGILYIAATPAPLKDHKKPTNRILPDSSKIISSSGYDRFSGLEINIIKVGTCEYIAVRGGNGVSVVHKQDCPYCKKLMESKHEHN